MILPFEQCPYLTTIPTLWNIFDFSYAPTLLFYAYIPIAVLSIFLGFFVLLKNKHEPLNRAFFFVSLFFCLFLLNQIVQWIAVNADIIVFSWSLYPLFQVALWISVIYFVNIFLSKIDIDFKSKVLLLLPVFVILLFLPTKFNISGFDPVNCEAISGYLLTTLYIFQVLVLVWIAYIGIKKYKSSNDLLLKKQIFYFIPAVVVFLTIFFLGQSLGEITKTYEINLIGPIGMVVFLGLMTYMIVRFQTFNIKLIATQALVWGLVILQGSQFFFIKTPTNFILNGIGFLGIIIAGYLIVKSVKKEIEQKEQLETLLQQRESLVHLVTHKVKGSFTRTKYIFAGILDGTLGVISPELKAWAEKGLESDNTGIQTVDLVLNAANLQKGTVKYDMKNVDFKDIILKTIDEHKAQIETQGLKIETDIRDDVYNIMGDVFWLKEAVNNLLENSLKYTKQGSIKFSLIKNNGKILFSVKDTGVGVTEEDKKNLFTEGGRGRDSMKVNVDSTGYGLYTVKLVIEAHGGRVWVESLGAGKGSTFCMELDAVKGA